MPHLDTWLVALWAAATLAAFVAMIVQVVRVVRGVRPGVDRWKDTDGQPLDLLVMPEKLSAAGRRARYRLAWAWVVFVLLVAAAVVAIWVDAWLRRHPS